MNEKLYQSNIQALQKKEPELYNRLVQVKLGTEYMVADNAMIGGKGFNLYCMQTKNFLYGTDSKIESAKVVDDLKIKNARVAVMLGIGLGYELNYFMAMCQKSNFTKAVILLEKEIEIFKWSLYFVDYATLLKNNSIRLLIGLREEQIKAKMTSILQEGLKLYLKTAKMIYNNGLLSWFKDYYQYAVAMFKEALHDAFIYIGDSPDDSLIGIKNMFLNLDEILSNPGINLLYDKFRGKPAVVVATGPSLNKNKHLLKGIADKALIVAADASLRVLLDIGVKPHLVTSLERLDITSKVFSDLPPEMEQETFLAACPVVDPLTYNLFKGPRLVVYRDFNHFKWLEVEKGTLPIGASSGNMAFKICEALGCDPIILIGQDLAYAEDNKTSHAAGHIYGEDYESDAQETMMVKANYGGIIKTHKLWNMFRNHYEMDIASYAGTCINSTEGGAYIEGTQVKSFQETIDEYVQDDFYPLQIIKDSIADFSTADVDKDKERIKNLLKRSEDDLIYMMDVLQDCLDYIQRSNKELSRLQKKAARINDNDRKRISKIFDSINSIWQKANSRKKTFDGLVAHVVQSYVITKMNEIYAVPDRYSDYHLAMIEQIFLSGEMYEGVKGLIEKILELVRKTEL